MLWTQKIKSFFTRPVFTGDLEKTVHVTLLSLTLNIGVVVLLIVLIGNILGDNVPTSVYITDAIALIIILALRYLLYKGHVRQTGNIFLIASFIFLTITNAMLGTIRTPTASAYILLIAMGCILFERRGAIVTVAMSSLAILGINLAQNAGLLPEPNLTVGITQWVSFTVFLGAAGVLTNFALHTIRQALVCADEELVLRRQAEATLRQRETFLRAITDNIQEMITLISLDGFLQYASPAYQRCLGYDPTAVIGQFGFDLIHPDDAEILQGYLKVALEEGRADKLVTFRARHADGRYICLEASAQFVNNEAGISGIVSVFRDVTAQREAQEQIRLLSRAVEASPISIVMTDVMGNLTYVNPKFTEITGYAFEEVRGHNPRILQSGETPLETYAQLWRTILAGQLWSGEFLNKRKDGRLYWESAVISPITDSTGQTTHFLAVKEDITDRKQMDRALRQSYSELHMRNEELDAFAHTVAHDLKTPLGVIVGFAELLLTNLHELSEEQTLDSLRALSSSGRKANTIIESLLLLSSVRQQDVRTEPLAMDAVIAEAVSRLTNQITSSSAHIQMQEPGAWPTALGHAPWVEEVWVNYISNALKYGGQPPSIVLSARRQPDGFVRFCVHDHGPGLTAVQQARLFTQFERLGKRNVHGHGLGLSIVSRIVGKLGGRVGVESEVGQGCTFYFTLPGTGVESSQD